jgi:MFS family permease
MSQHGNRRWLPSPATGHGAAAKRAAATPRAAGRLAWSVCALTVTISGLVVWLQALTSPLGELGVVLAAGVVVLAFAALGALIAARRPGNAIGWLMCAIACTGAIGNLASTVANYTLVERPGVLPAGAAAAWLSAWLWAPPLWSLGTFLPLLFPDGRLPSRRWRPVAWLAAAAITASVLANAFTQWSAPDYPDPPSWPIDNPLGIQGAEDILLPVSQIASVVLTLTMLATVASLLLRLRRSQGQQRQQLKWFLFGVTCAIVGVVVGNGFLYAAGGGWRAAGGVLFAAGVLALPATIAVAVLRYRLYEVDRIINRALVYGALTALLGGVYAAVVLLLGQLLGRDSSLAVAGATLAVAALVQPARRRIQDAVDRRFNRRRYDAARTVEMFSTRLRDEIDLDTLTSELLAVVEETMQPTKASLWLRPTTRAP